jgi:recombination protein RecA
LQVVDTVLRSHAVQLIAVDSVAALLPRAEQEGDIGMTKVRGGLLLTLLCDAANAA